MIGLKLKELLEAQGRTGYWLAKETGIRYASVWQMCNGDSARLSLDNLDKICDALGCQPGDVLVRVPDRRARKGKR